MTRPVRSVHRRGKLGQLVVFEGVDGVGKSTLAARLHSHLTGRGIPCSLHSFPGREPGTLGAHVYRLYHAPLKFGIKSLTPTALQLLVTAAHVEVIEQRIVPDLRQGRVVVLDRYWWSTWVYGRSDQVPESTLAALLRVEKLVWQGIKPAAVFLVSRKKSARTEHTRPKREKLQRLYRRLSVQEATRYRVLNLRNDRTIETALRTLLKHLTGLPRIVR